MRSIALLAVVTGALALAVGCSDSGGGVQPPENTGPVADFDLPSCSVNAPCSFTSTSTDDHAVTGWSWDFNGDGTPDATTADASFMYATAADFNVSLTVRDAEGMSSTTTKTVTVAPPGNQAPVANFAIPSCTINVPCGFASTSTDDIGVTEWSWDFNGDGTPDATAADGTFTYTAAGSFNVGLTVRDAGGLSNTKSASITIAPPAVNTPPTAGFTYTCDSGICSFTSTSTDVAPGTITSYHWSFGDTRTADEANPVHPYVITVPQTFTVSLTVTDNEGATDSESQVISVSPPVAGAEGCVTDDFIVKCALNVTAASTMKVTLLTVDCDRSLESTRLIVPPPISDKVFLHVCGASAGDAIGIYGGVGDKLIVYEAGSQVLLWFKQGTPDLNHPPIAPPSGRLEGTFPDWTLYFDDGTNPTGTGEPDMNDLIAGVHATLK
jgi:PKD repeat protein